MAKLYLRTSLLLAAMVIVTVVFFADFSSIDDILGSSHSSSLTSDSISDSSSASASANTSAAPLLDTFPSPTTLPTTTPPTTTLKLVDIPITNIASLITQRPHLVDCADCSRQCPYCEKERLAFYERHMNYCTEKYNPPLQDNKPLCHCFPDQLIGYEKPNFDVPTMGELRNKYQNTVKLGGWSPPDCTARQRIAMIIPCRDREEHLKIFLNRINVIMQRQKLAYQVFVIEQVSPELFNKASMMNIAFLQAKQHGDFDCYVFHDVDMIPENDNNMYTCLNEMPRHVGSFLDKFGYRIKFPRNFGGATAFTSEQFKRVNGFSNTFYGWGGEDDDMYYRIHKSGMWIDRYPSTIARYSMIKHAHDKRNKINNKRHAILRTIHKGLTYQNEGLNTLKYDLISTIDKPLYRLIYASVPSI